MFNTLTKIAALALTVTASSAAFAGGVTTPNQPTTAPSGVVSGSLFTVVTNSVAFIFTPPSTRPGLAFITASSSVSAFVNALE